MQKLEVVLEVAQVGLGLPSDRQGIHVHGCNGRGARGCRFHACNNVEQITSMYCRAVACSTTNPVNCCIEPE